MEEGLQRGRLFSDFAVQLCSEENAPALELGSQRFTPDATKAYVAFKISHGVPSRTAYGTMIHPGTVANSYPSMLHQVFNLSHLMRSYDESKEHKDIPRDYQLGTIVGVELTQPSPPLGGTWKFTDDPAKSTAIRGVAVMHKMAERVPKILGEYLAGRKKWSVSMEVIYSKSASGFVVHNRDDANKGAEELMAEHSPSEMNGLNWGYVPWEAAPDELKGSYSSEKRRIVKDWKGGGKGGKGLAVSMLKGGINGQVHYHGVGLVSVGAEREAEVERMLASDPDAIELSEMEFAELFAHFKISSEESNKLLTDLRKFAPEQS